MARRLGKKRHENLDKKKRRKERWGEVEE